MNDGPLPSSAPPFLPAARINYASDLLGDSSVSPYDYGKPTNLSDQTSYLNIAHRMQKIIPQLNLPNANSEGSFALSHAVDIGDIGFVLRIDRRGSVVKNIAAFERLQLTRMVDPIVNLVTVNYLLAGLQRFWNKREAHNWQQLMVDLRFVEDAYAERGAFTVRDAIRFISEVARPWGVPHTSELQGGQHEGGHGPVTFPVNFISTFFVCGLTRNMCNIWSQSNVSAGDDLIFKLERLPIAVKDGSVKYHLNHWKKSIAVQQFKYEDGGVNDAWQIVPAVLSTYTPSQMHEGYDYRQNGYWHITRSQVMARNESSEDRRYLDAPNIGIYHDDRAAMRGALVEGTFEPVWVEYWPWQPQRGVKRVCECSCSGSRKRVSRFDPPPPPPPGKDPPPPPPPGGRSPPGGGGGGDGDPPQTGGARPPSGGDGGGGPPQTGGARPPSGGGGGGGGPPPVGRRPPSGGGGGPGGGGPPPPGKDPPLLAGLPPSDNLAATKLVPQDDTSRRGHLPGQVLTGTGMKGPPTSTRPGTADGRPTSAPSASSMVGRPTSAPAAARGGADAVAGEVVDDMIDKATKSASELDADEELDGVSSLKPPASPLVPPTTVPATAEFTAPAAKKTRRPLGLAVGLSNLAAGGSVMVEAVKSGWGSSAAP